MRLRFDQLIWTNNINLNDIYDIKKIQYKKITFKICK